MWKKINGYPYYEICEEGKVKSLARGKKKNDKILKNTLLKTGYYHVDLCYEGKRTKKLIHRLLAEAFIENKENKPQVNHINGIKSDNRLENLEWVTISENQLHSIKAGLRHTKGEKNSQCKLKEYDVLFILNDKRKYKDIANNFNISISTVADIKRGYSWTHITKINNIR